MKKKIVSGFLSLLLGMMIIGCGSQPKTSEENGTKEDNKINVMVSFYPLQEFTEAIGKDKVNVSCIIPNNMEPHDYEPKTKDFEKLIKSDLFIYNGLGLENWVQQVKDSIKDESVMIVDSSIGVDKLTINHEEDAEHEHGGIDPHSWLSLKQAQIQSENIKNALVKIDPENKDYYEKNYSEFKQKLEDLYNQYKDKFASLSSKDFITGHAAFGYLCRDFGLQQKSVENVFGEGEPTPKQLQGLVNFCKENNIKIIFSESLASPKVSETLASEVGAKVVSIYTLESKEDDKSYLEAMEYNLDQIYKCLEEQK